MADSSLKKDAVIQELGRAVKDVRNSPFIDSAFLPFLYSASDPHSRESPCQNIAASAGVLRTWRCEPHYGTKPLTRCAVRPSGRHLSRWVVQKVSRAAALLALRPPLYAQRHCYTSTLDHAQFLGCHTSASQFEGKSCFGGSPVDFLGSSHLITPLRSWTNRKTSKRSLGPGEHGSAWRSMRAR